MDTKTEYIEAALRAISADYRSLQGRKDRTIFCGLGGQDPAAFNIKIRKSGRVRAWTYLTKDLREEAADSFRSLCFKNKAGAETGMKVTEDGVLMFYYEEPVRGGETPDLSVSIPSFEAVLRVFLSCLDSFQLRLAAREIPLLHERLIFCDNRASPEGEGEPDAARREHSGDCAGPGELFGQLKEAFEMLIRESFESSGSVREKL